MQSEKRVPKESDGVVMGKRPSDPVERMKWTMEKNHRLHMERHRQRLIEEANTEAELETERTD